MASIINSRKCKQGVVLEIQTNYEEYLQLKGHLNDIHLFTEHTSMVKTNISQRGKNEATKYFLIPRELRKGFNFNSAITCQKIDEDDKVIFVYVVNKLKTNPPRREKVVKKYAG